jgi:hypothetical protein
LPESYGLCLEEDDFLCDKSIWVASLSNGLDVYQDDNRGCLEEPSAWKRLASYILDSGTKIVGMKLKFRSHIIEIPSNADGYYFACGMSKTSESDVQRGYLVCGALIDGVATCKWYNIPELTVERKYPRPLSELEPPFLILNPT